MQRDFVRESERHPGQVDRFRMRSRWVRSKGTHVVYLTDAPAGEEPTTVQEAPESFFVLMDAITEELLAEGWQRC